MFLVKLIKPFEENKLILWVYLVHINKLILIICNTIKHKRAQEGNNTRGSEDYIQPHLHANLPHLATIDGATSTLYEAFKTYKLCIVMILNQCFAKN